MKNIPTVPAKSIVYKTGGSPVSPWLDYSMNVYRGCSHGCIYCDSRSDCFKNTDFDIVKVKENALQIVRDDLRRKIKTGIVASGAMSDPYNPLEEELKLTRNSLELINAFGFGASLVTKSALITRDTDILQNIQSHSPVIVKFSITAADDGLCQLLEPNVSVTSERIKALGVLADSGIFCGVWLNPMLPFITDTEENVTEILKMIKDAGAKFVHTYMGMTMRPGSREYYYNHLNKLFPGVREKHIKQYGLRKHCESPNAKNLWTVFASQCEKLGLLYSMRAIIAQSRANYESRQLTLF